jgi:4-hydroxysphinganine ceramide fatty acyl 2-hydroxylase
MGDEDQHVHSRSAYDMMDEYKVGELGGDEKIVSEGENWLTFETGCTSLTYIPDWVPREDFHPDETDALADFNRNQFLDLTKPLLMQVWYARFTKEYYLSQVHNPRHLKESARLFKWDALEVSYLIIERCNRVADFLQALTRTKWWVVPMVWGPIATFLFALSALQFTDS